MSYAFRVGERVSCVGTVVGTDYGTGVVSDMLFVRVDFIPKNPDSVTVQLNDTVCVPSRSVHQITDEGIAVFKMLLDEEQALIHALLDRVASRDSDEGLLALRVRNLLKPTLIGYSPKENE